MELLDTEGLVFASPCTEAGSLLSIDCHFDVVILNKSLRSVWSDGAGLPSRWYIVKLWITTVGWLLSSGCNE